VLACQMLLASIGAAFQVEEPKLPDDDGWGRPPILEKERPPLQPKTDDLQPPIPPRGGPDGDDVQVSTPSNRNQNETVMRVNPLDRDHLIGGANDERSGSYTCAFYASLDGGLSWNELLYSAPSGFAGDPAAAFGPGGEVYFCPLEFGSYNEILVGRSFDGGLTVPNGTSPFRAAARSMTSSSWPPT